MLRTPCAVLVCTTQQTAKRWLPALQRETQRRAPAFGGRRGRFHQLGALLLLLLSPLARPLVCRRLGLHN